MTLTHCSKAYRLQFLNTLTADAPAILGENELSAADIEGALWEMDHLPWPPGALACRLSAVDGGEVAFCMRPNSERRAALLAKFA